jgi:hypothetical protein
MGFREMRTYWPSSLAGAFCALVTMLGMFLAAFTERKGLGALLIVGGFALLILFVVVASKLRKPGQPF